MHVFAPFLAFTEIAVSDTKLRAVKKKAEERGESGRDEAISTYPQGPI